MKKSILSIFLFVGLLFSGSHLFAQSFTIEPGESSTSVDPSEFDVAAYGFVINNSSETTDFVWEREIITLTAGWETAVCDKNQCHFWDVDTENFTLAGGEQGTLDVHVYPFDNDGSAIVLVHVWAVSDPATVVTGSYYFNAAVSVPERLTEAITLYPNPADELLFVKQGEEEQVERMEVYSLSGKMVLNERLMSNNAIEVSALPTGTYVARLFNNEDTQISSNVVIKR